MGKKICFSPVTITNILYPWNPTGVFLSKITENFIWTIFYLVCVECNQHFWLFAYKILRDYWQNICTKNVQNKIEKGPLLATTESTYIVSTLKLLGLVSWLPLFWIIYETWNDSQCHGKKVPSTRSVSSITDINSNP